MSLFRLWFGLSAPVSRRAYALSGFGLMAVKYAVEALAIDQATGQWLSPLAYLSPLLSSRFDVLHGHDGLLAAVILWTLPFLWVGVSMTLRRLEDAGRSPVLATLYFVPLVNYMLMLTLCVLPSRRRVALDVRPEGPGQTGGLRSALSGAAVGALLAVAGVLVSVLAFGTYGTTLFLATPFLMGAASAYLFNRELDRPVGKTLAVAICSVGLAGAAILLFALEGLICLAMAAPLALLLALLGALVGRRLAPRGSAVPSMALVPLVLCAGVDAVPAPRGLREVVTVVEVGAPPAAVWPNVVAFSTIPEPPAWYFRLGVAYPQRAVIRGNGVGALRRCEFSTGAFVEPITAWDEPRRLAFDIVAQPPPMHELSPYRHVLAPHLDRYLVVREGEFVLEPRPGGRTRLLGRTRYEMRIMPDGYWGLWADALIHAIHRRVLEHIREAAEASRAS